MRADWRPFFRLPEAAPGAEPSEMTGGAQDDRIPLMAFGERFVVYIDILGWTELTNSGADVTILKTLEGIRNGDPGGLLAKTAAPAATTIRSSYFSDTIVYSCEPTAGEAKWLILHVQAVCAALLADGHLTRGAISIGKLAHEQEVVAGSALIEVHKMERCVATYPRLILSDRAASFIGEAPISLRSGALEASCRPRILTDRDGLPFLDIFLVTDAGLRPRMVHQMAVDARPKIAAKSARTRDAAAYSDPIRALNHRAKHEWMLGYLDKVIGEPVDPAT